MLRRSDREKLRTPVKLQPTQRGYVKSSLLYCSTEPRIATMGLVCQSQKCLLIYSLFVTMPEALGIMDRKKVFSMPHAWV